ncbi:MAG TPA: HEAT repeat domain-containing protein, partial [Myxococcota bacterium]
MSVRLFHPEHTARRFAVVNLQPHVEGQVHVVVARGASRLSLTDHQLYGPFPLAEAELRQTEILAALRADGYVDGGLAALVTTIATSKSPKARARAAERLGWRRDVGGVAALVARAAHPKDDITAVITALGRIGDRSALPAVHAEAARKLLSRRRAGSEALRQLGDVDSLRIVAEAALARLPSSLQTPSLSRDAIVAAFKALPFSEQGAA